MAAEYLAQEQTVLLDSPVLFDASTPCRKGNVYHQDGSGVFILKGRTPNCFATYTVEFTGNIAVPTGGTAGPIAIAIAVNGEQRPGSRSIVTPAAVDEYGNVDAVATIDVPKGCCFTMTARYVNGNVDAAATPAPAISVVDGKLDINRTA